MTPGDPRGIGPEVVAKALALGPLDAEITVLGDERSAPPSLLPEAAGRIAGEAVEQAVRLALAGEVDAIVTGPVHKHALHLAGFPYPGLTELLSHLAGDVDVAMMLAAGPLRVVLVTTHIPLKDVPAAVTTARVVACGRIAERALREWWGIGAPRLALCALNPHAGESGLFGDEDERVLAPAAKALGAAGPLPVPDYEDLRVQRPERERFGQHLRPDPPRVAGRHGEAGTAGGGHAARTGRRRRSCGAAGRGSV